MQVGELWVNISGKTEAFNAAMAQVENTIKAAANRAEASSQAVLKRVSIAAAAAGAAIGAIGLKSIESTANAQAMNAQFEQVFGAIQNRAQDVVNGLGEDFGMLPNRLKPALTSMTSMFKGLGYDTQEAMKMAEQGVTIAADAAAFYDKSYEEANAALNSFIKGNYEGGEAIGLFGNETQIAAYAADKLGISWKDADEAQKQLARLEYAEAMQKAAGATGQAARESESYQNQLGNLKQGWIDFTAVIGQPLLEPAINALKNMTEHLTAFKNLVTEQGLAGAIEKIFPDWLEGTIVTIAGAITAAMIPAFISMATAAWAAIVPLAPFLAAGAAIGALAYVIIKNWEPIKGFFVDLWEGIKTKTLEIWNAIEQFLVDWWSYLLGALAGPIGLVTAAIISNWDTIKAKASQLWVAIKVAFDNIKSHVMGVIQNALQWGKDIVQGLINGIKNKIAAVKKVAGELADDIKNKIKSALQIHSPSKVMEGYGQNIAEGLAQGISENKDKVMAALDIQTHAAEAKFKEMQARLQQIQNDAAQKQQENNRKSLQVEIANADAKVKLAEQDLTLKKQQLASLQQHGKDTSIILQSIAKSEQSLTEAKQAAVEARAKLDEFETKAQVDATQKQIDSLKSQQKALQDYQDLLADAKAVVTKYYADMEAARADYDKKVADAQAQEIANEKQVTAAYEKAVDDRAKALSDFVGLFDEVSNKDVSGEQLLNNLRGQVSAFEDWQQNIHALAARGVNEGLIAELKEMGPKAGPEIAALNTLTDDQLKQYVALWKQKNQDARTEAVSELAQQKIEMEQKLVEIRISAEQQLEQYRIDWQTKNAEIRKNAMTELTTIETKFKEINEASTTYGSSLMTGFISGIQSKRSELEEALQEIAATVDAYMPHSPAKKGALSRLNEWGPALVKNFADGIQKSIPTLEYAMANMASVSPAMLGPSISTTQISTSTSNNYGGNKIIIQAYNWSQIERELNRRGVRF